MKWITFSILFFTFLKLPLCWAKPDVAKVLILKGTVKAKDPDTGKVYTLNKGKWIKEGAIVQTAAKSFVKMVFKDRSNVNLGPKSQMVIAKFPKKEAGVLKLIKGSIRAKVQKDLLKKGTDSKMFIKTKTAAMGVRGTDFQVTHNTQTNNTAVVTYEGEVGMAQIDPTQNINSNAALERAINSDNAVRVREGQFSGSTQSGRPNIPVKINPAQFNALKNSDSVAGSSGQSKNTKNFQSPIPPGVPTKAFVNNADVGQGLAQAVGQDAAKNIVENATEKVEAAASNSPPPEGIKNSDGSFAPPGGGIINMDVGAYIAPPPGSVFDPNTQTYQTPPEFGGFDANGNFQAPKGLIMDEKGEYKPVAGNVRRFIPKVAPIEQAANYSTQMVQSVGDWDNKVEGQLTDRPLADASTNEKDDDGAIEDGSDPCQIDPNLCNIVDDILQDALQDNSADDESIPTTTVRFNIST